MIETAYAKINLALHVRSRRDDGYHALETWFAFAEDGDALSAERAASLSLVIEGPFAKGLSAGDDNLVLRAARALRSALAIDAGAAIRLDKRLPVASGIGGGSADAAATLRLLARLWGVAVPDAVLAAIASPLGADVPACIASVCAFGGGRGDDLRAIANPLAGAPLLLVNPGMAVATGPVFAGWDRIDRGGLPPQMDLASVQAARNDLEPPARELAPAIAPLLDMLSAAPGVRIARMSGSGATCFALFEDIAARDRCRAEIARAIPGCWTLASRLR